MHSVKIFQGENAAAVEKEINDYLLAEHGPQIVQLAQTESPAEPPESGERKLTVTLVLQEPY